MAEFDVVVIGGGPGGYPAAIRAAQLGAKVALVEKRDLGGTCLNRGCIPTKTLMASSGLVEQIRRAGQMGVETGSVSVDWPAMVERKNEVVATLKGGVAQLLEANGIQVFSGTGSFVDTNTIRVASRGSRQDERLRAGATVIATGSDSVVPEGLPRSSRVLDSTKLLAAKRLPTSLMVLGGGYIGCEFASMAAQLGVDVTIVEMLDDILVALDRDIRSELKRHMKTLGVRILTGHPLEQIRATKATVAGVVDGDEVSADTLLVSVGRRPITQGLALGKIGLETTDTGSIPVDACCRTSRSGIYAVGDVMEGSTQLAHAATSQGVTAAENICSGGRKPAERLVPACIFTSPEIGVVGLSEQQAKEAGRAVDTGKFRFGGLGRALASGDTNGFAKWIADPVTGQLLGAGVVGAHATELIAEAAAAIKSELTVDDVAETVHCHPTLSEAWMEAAHVLRGKCVHAPPRRKR